MALIKRIREGEVVPAWYGTAWRCWQSNSTACLPLGLNLLASLVRSIYYWLKHAPRAIFVNPRAAYDQGYRKGKSEQTHDHPSQ